MKQGEREVHRRSDKRERERQERERERVGSNGHYSLREREKERERETTNRSPHSSYLFDLWGQLQDRGVALVVPSETLALLHPPHNRRIHREVHQRKHVTLGHTHTHTQTHIHTPAGFVGGGASAAGFSSRRASGGCIYGSGQAGERGVLKVCAETPKTFKN